MKRYQELSLMTDLYELTMMQGFFEKNQAKRKAVFEVFYRENPFHGGFALCAGLSQVMEYLMSLHFTQDDIEYLRSLGLFREDFLKYLKNFRFSGTVEAVPEGTVIFPKEPILRITAPIVESQLLEPAVLSFLNHQCLIATKAARICLAAGGDEVLDFGLRQAQGPDAAILGSRAAVIGGAAATSDVLTGKSFQVPVRGTHGDTFVLFFDSEIEAFRAYAAAYPDTCIFLVDTYDALSSGIPNAITVFQELISQGKKPKVMGIRIDSGDLLHLSKEARRMFEEAGLSDVKIAASGDLDEYAIEKLKGQGAKIDLWGVGTRLITAEGNPSFGGVYKLVAKEEGGRMEPAVKPSENQYKMTVPGVKNLCRLYDEETHEIRFDVLALPHESISAEEDVEAVDAQTGSIMRADKGTFYVRPLLEKIMSGGCRVAELPPVLEIQKKAKQELLSLPESLRALTVEDPPRVGLTKELYALCRRLNHDEL